MPEAFPLLLKRAFDLAICLVALPVLLPMMAIVAFVVRIGMGSPVLFRQLRPGLHARPFTILKFRTMRDEYDPAGRLRPDAQRLTALGALLRKFSLDELPQMWNVLNGHMSLVGPRPLLMDYLSCYSERHRNRHAVKPGITGWAQVRGRNAIRWEDRLELDMWYVEHWSFAFDLRILFLTVKCVLLRHGVSNPDHATMPEFTGLQNSTSDAALCAEYGQGSHFQQAAAASARRSREELIGSANYPPLRKHRKTEAQGCHADISTAKR